MTWCPSDLHKYRRETAQQARMAGVMRPSFWCRGCGLRRDVQGRKRGADGWRCQACAAGGAA